MFKKYLLIFSLMVIALITFAVTSDTATIVNPANLGADTSMVHTLFNLFTPLVGPKFAPYMPILSTIIIFVLGFLARHYWPSKSTPKVDSNTSTGTAVILLLLLMGMGSCKSTSTMFTGNSVQVKEAIGTKGVYCEEYGVIHTAPMSYDTAAILFVSPDSLSGTLFNDITNFIANHNGSIVPLKGK